MIGSESVPASALKTETPLKLISVDDFARLVKTRPGARIEGFGQIPKAEPLSEPHHAFRTKDIAPDPDDLQKALDLEHRFHHEGVVGRSLDYFGATLVKLRDEGRCPLSDGEIQSMVAYRAAHIGESVHRQYATLWEDIRKDHESQRMEIEKRKQERIALAEKDYAENPVDREGHGTKYKWKSEKEWEEIPLTEEECRQATREAYEDRLRWAQEDADKKISDIPSFSSYNILSSFSERRFEGAPKGTDAEATAARVDQTALTFIKSIMSGLRDHMNQCRSAVFQGEDINRMYEAQGEHGVQTKIRQVVRSVFPPEEDLEAFCETIEAKLFAHVMQVCKKPGGFVDSHYWDPLPELMEGEAVPAEYVTKTYAEWTKAYDTADTLPETLAARYENVTAYYFRGEGDFPSYARYYQLQWDHSYPAQAAVTAWEKKNYINEYHYRRLKAENKKHPPFLGGEYFDAKTFDGPLNTILADPSLPSETALAEVRARETLREIAIVPGYELEWALIEKMLIKQGIDPKEWYNWALSTETGGAAGLAQRFRNEAGDHMVKLKKEQDGGFYQYDDETRFPEQEELLSNLERLDAVCRGDGHPDYRPRDHVGREAFQLSLVPARLDRENALGKYRLSPRQWVDMYSDAYRIYQRDYAGNTEYDIAAIRGSLMSIIAGHEQKYSPGMKDFSETNSNRFDAVDFLLSLPEIARENNNDPGFLQLGYRVLVGMDDRLRDLYGEEIRFAFNRYLDGAPMVQWALDAIQRGDCPDYMVPSSDLCFNISNNPDRLPGFTKRAIAISRADPETGFRVSMNEYTKPWNDPDIAIHPQTGELMPRPDKPEEVFETMAASIQRTALVSPETALLVTEIVAEKEANTTLEPLTAAMDLVQILTGESIPPADVSRMFAYADQVNAVAARLPGSTPEEAEELLASLSVPLSAEELSMEGTLTQLWVAAGHAEREQIAADIIRTVNSAFRISVWRARRRIQEYQRQRYAQELEVLAGMSPAEAKNSAHDAIAWGTQKSQERLSERLAALDEARGAEHPDEEEIRKRKEALSEQTLQETMALMQELARVTDYNFANTHWLQVVDQLFGKSEEAGNFFDTDGRMQLYCVQSSFLLYEMLRDTLYPLEGKQWEKPLEFAISIEDEMYGLSVDDYFTNLARKVLTGKSGFDNFNHYFVHMSLPQVDPADAQVHMVLDQTQGIIRRFSDDAILTQTEDELVLDNENVLELRFAPIAPTDQKPKRKTRLIASKRIDGQTLDIAGLVMDSIEPLKGYAEKLDRNSPVTHFAVATDGKRSAADRLVSLGTLIRRFPYFMGETSFSGRPKYQKRLLSIIDLCNKADLPVVGLFAAKTLALNDVGAQETTADETMLARFIDRAALLPDAEWTMHKAQYGHILMDKDKDVIEKKREEYKSMETLERLSRDVELKETLETGCAEDIDAAETREKEEMKGEKDAKEVINEEPGSWRRFEVAGTRIQAHAKRVQAVFADPGVSLLSSQAEGAANPNDVTTASLSVHAPLRLTTDAALQAAKYLTEGVEGAAMQKELAVFGLVWRAFMHDARRNRNFRQVSWEMLEQSMREALAAKEGHGIDPEHPLGRREDILRLPAGEVRARILRHFGNRSGALLFSPEEVAQIPATSIGS